METDAILLLLWDSVYILPLHGEGDRMETRRQWK